MTRAVVFAYHNVGVRCLKVLLAHGVDVPLVVTHDDEPGEKIWFDSVAATAAEYGIPTTVPTIPNAPDTVRAHCDAGARFRVLVLLPEDAEGAAARVAADRRAQHARIAAAAVPRPRTRELGGAHGERETGATLHYMTEKPDNGDIVAQTAVPILADDTAREVFDKVTVAAELTLDGALPALLAGAARRTPAGPETRELLRRPTPEDGIIDWSRDATAIHDLVRAVAPPYPGAFTLVGGIARSRVAHPRRRFQHAADAHADDGADRGRLLAHCGGGGTLRVFALEARRGTRDAARRSPHCSGPRRHRSEVPDA